MFGRMYMLYKLKCIGNFFTLINDFIVDLEYRENSKSIDRDRQGPRVITIAEMKPI